MLNGPVTTAGGGASLELLESACEPLNGLLWSWQPLCMGAECVEHGGTYSSAGMAHVMLLCIAWPIWRWQQLIDVNKMRTWLLVGVR